MNSVIVSIEALRIGFKATFKSLSFTLTLSLSLSHCLMKLHIFDFTGLL
ncbi:hypothetical protein CFP56_032700 [Quercus suber]|uniref:Uncharacterized protein n=1 Tax=Quercus suber TaxID=58331 RepID=A0AAW0JGH8_QUESU